MKKKEKKSNYYFDAFPILAHYSVLCGEALLDYFEHFDPAKEEEIKTSIHMIEHQADDKKHEVTEKLLTEFITPIDREDIVMLLKEIDDVTDAVEEISLKLFLYNYQELPPDAVEFMRVTVECLRKTEECLRHFPEYEDLPAIKPYIDEVIHLEEQGDVKYIEDMRHLYLHEQNGWVRHKAEALYTMLESVSDQCREVCRFVQTISFKNL